MIRAAKVVMINPDGKFLLLYRANHPVFGTDPDLPGGTIEDAEVLLDGMLREIKEEIGLNWVDGEIREIYSGDEYANHNYYYSLFITKLKTRPEITLSWEHSSFEWLDRDDFISRVKVANDTYMHMAYDVVSKIPESEI